MRWEDFLTRVCSAEMPGIQPHSCFILTSAPRKFTERVTDRTPKPKGSTQSIVPIPGDGVPVIVPC